MGQGSSLLGGALLWLLNLLPGLSVMLVPFISCFSHLITFVPFYLFIWLENPNKGLCVRLKVFYLTIEYLFRSVLDVWIDACDLSLTNLCLDADFTILYIFPPVYDLLTNYGTLMIPSLEVTSRQVLG